MDDVSPGLQERYRSALDTYLDPADGEVAEIALIQALELGRSAASAGKTLLDLVALHHTEVAPRIARAPGIDDIRQRLAEADAFLTQVLAPYEMSHRGWHDAVAQLRQTNLKLEQEVAERTQALRETEQRFRDVAESAADWIWESGPDHRLTYMSDSADGQPVPAENAVGKTRWEIAGGDPLQDEPWRRHKADLDAHRPFRDFRYVFSAGDGGATHHFRVNGKPVFDDLGCFRGYRGMTSDETAIVAARQRAQQAEEQLHQAQKMEAVGQLTGGMAHDFNNLLLVIIGNLGLLLEDKSNDPEIQEPVRAALEAAQRGAELTRSLLAFARRQPLRPQRVPLNELVKGITKLLDRTLGEQIEIELDLDPDCWPIMVDPAQLQAALANLATNARDAMPKGGRLSFRTSNHPLDADYAAQHADVTPGDYALIEVSDTGTGMTREVMAQIFEPFFTTKPRGQGTGLGLSMVFGFVKQSGGHISVYSEPGVGTTMRLYLPRDRRSSDRDRPVDAKPLERGRGETVLVVEDNPSLRRLVVRQVTGLGYQVEQAESPAQALTRLECGGPVDLLFSDVVMPGKIDGYDLAQIVFDRWPSIRVVLTSGFPGATLDRGDGRMNSIRLLTKPYQREDLARMLRQVLDDHHAGP